MADTAETNVTPISADSKLTDEQKREKLRERIEAGEQRNEERTLAEQAKDAADSAMEFTKKHPFAVVGGVLLAGLAIGAMTRPGRRIGRRASFDTGRSGRGGRRIRRGRGGRRIVRSFEMSTSDVEHRCELEARKRNVVTRSNTLGKTYRASGGACEATRTRICLRPLQSGTHSRQGAIRNRP